MMSIRRGGSADIWVGMAHVKPSSDHALLEGALGAYVSVVARALDLAEYRQAVSSALNELGFRVLELEDVESWRSRIRSGSPEPRLVDLANSITTENPVAVGTFDAYDNE